MAGSTDYNVELVLTAQNKMSGELKKVSADLVNMKKQSATSATAMKSSFWAIAKAAAWIWIAMVMKKFIGSTIELAWNLEQARVAFTTMLWSWEAAEDMLKRLTEFAKRTPFELTGIRQTAKQLLAMGTASEDMIPTMKMLWDVSSWLSVPIDRLALAFGKVQIAGKMSWLELRQFTIAWVPMISELAKNLWVTKWEISKMVAAGKIWFSDVENAFKTMTENGGKFANLMEMQSNTFQGAVSNMQDSIDSMKETLGTAFIPILTQAVQWMTPIIEMIGEWARANPWLAATLFWVVAVVTLLWVAIAVLWWPMTAIIGWVALLSAWLMLLASWFNKMKSESEKLAEVTNEVQKRYTDLNDEINKNNTSIKWNFDAIKKLTEEKNLWILTEDEYNKAVGKVTDGIIVQTNAFVMNTKEAIRNRIEKLKSLQAEYDALSKVDEKTRELWGTTQWAWQNMNVAFAIVQDQILKTWAEIWWLDMSIQEAEATLETLGQWAFDAYKTMQEESETAIEDAEKLKEAVGKTNEELKKSKEYDLDKINEAFETSYDTVKDLIGEIWNLKAQLNKLGEWEAKDVATRFLEIQDAIAKIKEWGVTSEEQPELSALQAEKWQAFNWIWEEESALLQAQIDKQREYNELTGIEKIREDYAVKAEKIQEELDLKTAALVVEQEKFMALYAKKADFEKKWMAVLAFDHVQQVAMYDALIAKAHALAAARRSANWSSWARAMWWPVASGREYLVWENGPEMFVPSSHWKIVPNNEITNNQWIEINLWWVTVANETDIDVLTSELARKIQLQREQGIS